MSDKIRWGILSTGRIAGKFATGLAAIPDAELVAVGSRSQESADRFGDEHNVLRRHPSYEALANDPVVDAIYVATPHPFHKDNAMLCLEAGKAVLCEKPFAMNAQEAEEAIRCARENKRFLMEAMWTRFIPANVKVRELLAENAIGDVRMVHAKFCFRSGWNPEGRLLNPKLGGGGLLDVGIYTVSYASMIMGRQPDRIVSLADIGETGVDEQASMVFGYDGGELATLTCAVRTRTRHDALISGTDGFIEVHEPFWHSQGLTLVTGEGEETFEIPHDDNGYQYEAMEVMRCLRAGKLESDVMPLDETHAIMKTLDRIREQWGLMYPME